VWALLVEGMGRPELTLLAIDRRGATLRRQRLVGWELEPGTGLYYDPTTNRLLAAMRRLGPPERPPEPARPVLIEATSLKLRPLQQEVRQAVWLPPG
jgi:hypothetical protein